MVRSIVIGVGALGRHHARLLSEMEDVELIGVADPNESQGRKVAEGLDSTWAADYRTLLDAGCDAVSIVVPTQLHQSVAEERLGRGIPVFVEKPITPTVIDAADLCDFASEAGVPLQVGHIERFNPAFTELARRTASPKYIRAERTAPYTFRSIDISVVLDLMIHDIDLVRALTEAEVLKVEAFGLCVMGGHPDSVQARLMLADGCIADLVASRVSPTVKRSFQVFSEIGCLTADLQEQKLTALTPTNQLLYGPSPVELASHPGADVAALKDQVFERFLSLEEVPIESRNALADELLHFIDCVRTGAQPLVSGEEGLAALRIAEEVSEAVDMHRWDGTSYGRVGPAPGVTFVDSQKRAA